MYVNPPKQGFGFGRSPSPFDDDFFSLGAPVGPGQPNRREDVIKVETILGNTGHHDLAKTDGPLGWWGERHETAVKAWQGENGLKVDGLLKPNGPTITSLRKSAGGLLGGFKPPSPDEVDEHHGRLAQGEPGLLNTRPARLSIRVPEQPPELDEQSLAFNADSARALTRTSVDGDVPKIYANYLKQAGAEGHTTVLDLVEQVNNAQGRDRAERVLHGIIGQLPPDQAKAFLGGEVPAPRPIGVRMADLADDDAVPLFKKGITQLVDGRLARNNAEGQEQEETPEQTPPTPPPGDKPPEGEEKPDDKPEDKPEEEEAKNEECERLQAVFEEKQAAMIELRDKLSNEETLLESIEADIDELTQQMHDLEELMAELAMQGKGDYDVGRIPQKLRYLLRIFPGLGAIRGIMEATDAAMEYYHNEILPRRSALEKERQEVLARKQELETSLEEAASAADAAANEFQTGCSGGGDESSGQIA
ncbi:MAG: hypothetical protein HQL42_20875 [Alphaproteobacteria bacterium]|nr:hypothetical protein [Alphaproteobacteria bacterium]